MRNYFKDGFGVIRRAIFEDYVNLYIVSIMLVFSLVDFIIWRLTIADRAYIYELLGIFPLRYLIIVLILNTTLALFSYDKEKEISYLLLSTNVLLSFFVLILEIFYLLSLK